MKPDWKLRDWFIVVMVIAGALACSVLVIRFNSPDNPGLREAVKFVAPEIPV